MITGLRGIGGPGQCYALNNISLLISDGKSRAAHRYDTSSEISYSLALMD